MVGASHEEGQEGSQRRNNFWHIALTAVVVALLVHNAINGGPAKARGHVLLLALRHSP